MKLPFKNNQHKFHFNPYVFDRKLLKLTKNGSEVSVGKLPLKILNILLSDQKHVFTRDEIKQELWPNTELIDTNRRLNTAIRALRLALGEGAHEPKYIETIRQVGYRWIRKRKFQFNHNLMRSYAPTVSIIASLVAFLFMFTNETEPPIKTEKIKVLVGKNTDPAELMHVLEELMEEYSGSDFQLNIKSESFNVKLNSKDNDVQSFREGAP